MLSVAGTRAYKDKATTTIRYDASAAASVGTGEDTSTLAPGTCVEVIGLESDGGRTLNGRKGIIQKSIEERGRLQVRLGPEKLASLKPANLKKVELSVSERLEVLGLAPAQSAPDTSGAAQTKAATAPAAFEPSAPEAAQAEVATAEAPAARANEEAQAAPVFRPGQCVEVFGLESENGRQMNGCKGLILRYLSDKGRFEVSLDKVVSLKPDNLRLVEFSLNAPDVNSEKGESETAVCPEPVVASRSRSRSRSQKRGLTTVKEPDGCNVASS